MSVAMEEFTIACRACGKPIRGEDDRTIHWKCEARDLGRLSQVASEELDAAATTLRRIFFVSEKGELSKDSRKLAIQIGKWLKRWRDRESTL